MADAWSDTEIAELKKLWAEGQPASFITKKIKGKSRSAVLGKIHRMRLGVNPRMGIAPKPKKQKIETVSIKAIKEIWPMTGVSLLAATRTQCRWPFGHPGDADFMLCGDDCATGKVYCQRHVEVSRSNVPLREITWPE
jgi:GcrA cell cycle regulator